MNALQVFEFNGLSLRAVTKDGEPWFVAKDVCDVLGMADTNMALKPLDADELSKFNLGNSPGQRGNPNRAIVSESGLYTLIMRSRKPEARQFRKWVTGTVLPAIRRRRTAVKAG